MDTNGKGCLGNVVVGEKWSGLRAGPIRRRALWAFCLSAELEASVGKKGRGGPIMKKPGGGERTVLWVKRQKCFCLLGFKRSVELGCKSECFYLSVFKTRSLM